MPWIMFITVVHANILRKFNQMYLLHVLAQIIYILKCKTANCIYMYSNNYRSHFKVRNCCYQSLIENLFQNLSTLMYVKDVWCTSYKVVVKLKSNF